MAETCVPFDTDAEIIALKATFTTTFQTFNSILGDDCSVFGTVSDLFRDAANVANQWERELKDAIKTILTEASKIFDAIKNFTGGMTQAAFDMIKSALSSVTNALSGIMTEVSNMMGAIAEAAQAIKMMSCDLISDGIKMIPPEIVAGAVAVSMVKAYDFAKDAAGNNIVGSLDVYNMSTNVLREKGIVGMKDNVINSAQSVANLGIPSNLSAFGCTVEVLPP